MSYYLDPAGHLHRQGRHTGYGIYKSDGSVNLAPFTDFKGCIQADVLRIEADASLVGDNVKPPEISCTTQCDEHSDCGTEEICESSTCTDSPLSGTLVMDSDWSEGYCAQVTITNEGDTTVSSWQVIMDFNDSAVTNLWNGDYVDSDELYTITPAAWNGTIEPGGTQSFGFCASKTGEDYSPVIISVRINE